MTSPYETGTVTEFPLSGDPTIDAFINRGFKWGAGGVGVGVTVSYSFPQGGAEWIGDYYDGEPFNGFQAFNAGQQQAARNALALWQEVANITFVEVAETPTVGATPGNVGDIRFGFSAVVTNDPYAIAWGYFPFSSPSFEFPEAGDVWFDPAYGPNLQMQPGQFGFSTLIHEIGHAIGLDHPFDDGGGEPVLPASMDNNQYTIMAYDGHPHPSVTTEAMTPMLLDILAIQYLYGANMTTRTGDDVYTFSNNGAVLKAIWDAGGDDTIDASNQTTWVGIDLRAGSFSSIGRNAGGSVTINNIAIAYGVTIENANGGSGDDGIQGNDVANRLFGGGGNDDLSGNGGNDTLDGGVGNDRMYGGSGNDTYYVNSAGDVIDEVGNSDVADEIRTTVSINMAVLGAGLIENARAWTSAAINITGNAKGNYILGSIDKNTLDGGGGDDILWGNDGNDLIIGGDGNDYLDGGTGNDTLRGGKGNDIYLIDNVNDIIDEQGNTDTGDDVRGYVSVNLNTLGGGAIDRAILFGSDDLNATGNARANRLAGSSGANILDGGGGDDLLLGGDGDDTLIGGGGNDWLSGAGGNDAFKGGAGSDTYVVDSPDEIVDEESNKDTGDQVRATFTVDLETYAGGQIETAVINGGDALHAYGSAAANLLWGNDAANILDGRGGDDTLIGNGGDDILIGGQGNDWIDGGDGSDSLKGDDGNDTLLGGAGHDFLQGGVGQDKLRGGSGNDTYLLEDLLDTVSEEGNKDTGDEIVAAFSITLVAYDGGSIENVTLLGGADLNATGTSASNKLVGNAGVNILDGGAGADTLLGAAGNDIYIVDNLGDIIDEEGNTDTADEVRSSISVDLAILGGGAIENAVLSGTAAINAAGNAGDNILTGNSARNVLQGGAGADTLIGGAGNDVYNVDSLADVVDEQLNSDIGDEVQTASFSIDLGTFANGRIEFGTLTGSAAHNLTGNKAANTLTGNDGANILDGGDGHDTLNGGGGDDLLVGGQGNDTIDGGQGTNTAKYAGASTDYSVTFSGKTAFVTDLAPGVNGDDGKDTLTNIRFLEFSDKTVVVNAPPGAISDTNAAGNSIAENDTNGTLVGITALATDTDTNTPLTYSLSDDAGGRFSINATTGVVSVADGSLINYEGAISHTIVIRATDSDGGFSSQSFVIDVRNLFPGSIQDADATANFVSENAINGTAVSVTAFSQDPAGGAVTYSLSDSAGGRFAINPTTGVVTVANQSLLDYETSKTHNITVFATDGKLTVGQSYAIAIGDETIESSINLSSIDGAAGFRLNGVNANDRSGFSVASAGDVNGDGFDDMIVGAFGATSNGATNAGMSYLVFGGASITDALDLADGKADGQLNLGQLNGVTGFQIGGVAKDDLSGYSASSAGDVNGDGYDDILVGSRDFEADGILNSGAAYVIYGGASNLATLDSADSSADGKLRLSLVGGANGFRLDGVAMNDQTGWYVSPAGDMNGDGFDDMIVGARSGSVDSAGHAGAAYIVFGGADSLAALDAADGASDSKMNLSVLDGITGYRFDGLQGSASSPKVGEIFVTSIGDLNGDGLDDIAVGSETTAPNGTSFVIFGGKGSLATLDAADGKVDGHLVADMLNGTTGYRILGPELGSGTGVAIDSGDVNSDGNLDLIIGDPYFKADGKYASGAAFVLFGGATNLATIDVADGAADGLISLSHVNGSNGFRLEGTAESDYAGSAVSSPGDIDGDGVDDLLIGVFRYDSDGIWESGAAFVVFGGTDNIAALDAADGVVDGALNLSSVNGATGFRLDGVADTDLWGLDVAAAGDVDGDGLPDYMVGSYVADSGGKGSAGSTYLVYGGSFGTGVATYVGDANDNNLAGNGTDEVFVGGLGADKVSGGGGRDALYAGGGNDAIHVADASFLRADGGGGADTLHLDYAGAIDFGNLDSNASTSDRGRIENVEVIDVANGHANALTLHLADVLDIDTTISDVGGIAALDNVLRIDGEASDTLQLFSADGWSSADTTTLAGYAIYTYQAVKVAVDTDIGVTVT